MSEPFQYDIFLSHSSKDKPVVRDIAERLKKDGLRVWFDEWDIRPGDSIPAKIEEGLERSRVLVLCMSANAFGSDWAQLESGTFRFRDPLNKDRRFVPLRLDDTQAPGSLGQFLHIDWRDEGRAEAYQNLSEACTGQARTGPHGQNQTSRTDESLPVRPIDHFRFNDIQVYSFSEDGLAAVTVNRSFLETWDTASKTLYKRFEIDSVGMSSIALSLDRQRAAVGRDLDKKVRVWDLRLGECIAEFRGHTDDVWTVSWSRDRRFLLSGGLDGTVRVWNTLNSECRHLLRHRSDVYAASWSFDQSLIVSGGDEGKLKLWNADEGNCVREFFGHTDLIYACLIIGDNKRIVSASADGTIRIWSVKGGRCLHILEGHHGDVLSLSVSSDNRYLLSGGEDCTVRLWHLKTGRRVITLNSHTRPVVSVKWTTPFGHAISGDRSGNICKWDLSSILTDFEEDLNLKTTSIGSNDVQYTNAKVLLVGEGDAGKTGLAKRLVHGAWQPSDKTVGAWATQWKLPVETKDGVEREIWLWDFGGQADQRLIHQLYMDHTALAVLVFDGQKADFYESLGQWDRDLSQVSGKVFTKLLTAGRTDLCPLRVSRSQVEAFATERGYSRFIETSAQAGTGCEELKKAILEGIRWDEIPWRSSPVLFKRLKDEIIRLKDEGRVLVRFNELRECLTLRLAGEDNRFDDAQLKTVISLLAGPGVVWELEFGSWVLLQPELINAYAQGAIKTIQSDEHERGCVAEERVLNGRLDFHSSMKRLGEDDERIVLLAMHRTLLARSLCLRERTEEGALLIFPSFYRRERPELVGHPAVLVSYTCSGFLDDIYSTLVVRLHHTKPFEQDKLWRYAADFKTLTGKLLGVKLNRKAEGAGELEVYFDPGIAVEEKIIFSKYVHEHLLANAKDVVRLRHYVCPHCGTPVANREVAMRRLAEGTKDILCVSCEKRVPLWDEMEELFSSERMRAKVRELEKQSQFVLDNESKERALVGDVISTVALAAQISREQSVSDHGIDMHLEFKTDSGEATGRMVFLQLKSGDSFLRTTRDGSEVFAIKNERHVGYWMDQPVPVYLVIRNSEGEIRWMEIRDYLIRESANGTKPVKQIIFDGERFDVMAVRRLRERMLRAG